MEVACKVIKKSNNISLTKPYEDFKNLNLMEFVQMNSYKKSIITFKSKEYQQIANSFMNNFFRNKKKNLGDTLLTAYLITAYDKQFFDDIDAPYETKLSYYASKIVILTEKMLKTKKPEEEFYGTVDYFNSLLSLWKMKDNVDTIADLYEQLKCTDFDNQKKLFDQMMNINVNLTFKMLLEDYTFIFKNDKLCKHLWSKLRHSLENNRENLYLILISEIRVKLIKTFKTCTDRKDIYYNIDTDKLIECIRENHFGPICVVKLVNLIYDKLKQYNPEFFLDLDDPPKLWEELFEKKLVRCIRKIYDEHERIASLMSSLL